MNMPPWATAWVAHPLGVILSDIFIATADYA